MSGYESAVGSQYNNAAEHAAQKYKDRKFQLLLEKEVRQNEAKFLPTEIATLHIQSKMCSQGQSMRIPVRIRSQLHENGYLLCTKRGCLTKLQLHKNLNEDSDETQAQLGKEMRHVHPEIDRKVTPLISLTVAVQT